MSEYERFSNPENIMRFFEGLMRKGNPDHRFWFRVLKGFASLIEIVQRGLSDGQDSVGGRTQGWLEETIDLLINHPGPTAVRTGTLLKPGMYGRFVSWFECMFVGRGQVIVDEIAPLLSELLSFEQQPSKPGDEKRIKNALRTTGNIVFVDQKDLQDGIEKVAPLGVYAYFYKKPENATGLGNDRFKRLLGRFSKPGNLPLIERLCHNVEFLENTGAMQRAQGENFLDVVEIGKLYHEGVLILGADYFDNIIVCSKRCD